MISDKVKNIIFKFLSDELKNSEIINYNGNIWFIDREKKYWYFELQKDGRLWWRYSFFNDFFSLFSLDSARFEPILKDWVEEVLNCKVNTTVRVVFFMNEEVEKVLNCKVDTTESSASKLPTCVEEVLNCKVNTTQKGLFNFTTSVEEVLNHKVDTTVSADYNDELRVEKALDCNVDTTSPRFLFHPSLVEDILNHTVTNMDGGEMIDEESYVDKVLNHTIK